MHHLATEFKEKLSIISDLKQQAKTEHNLLEVLIISSVAILSSANNLKAIHEFAVADGPTAISSG